MAASETTLIEKFEIISTEGKAVEISGGISAFFYYEDIFSPCVTAKAVLMDTGKTIIDGKYTNLFSGLPLRTSETCEVEIVNQLEQRFVLAQGNMFVNKISANKREQNRQIGALHFISGEAFNNEFTRVEQYLRPVQTHLNVGKIVEEVLGSEKPFLADNSKTQIGWQGNSRKPFTCIMQLATRSVAENGSSPGFCFFETSRGFQFRSVESMCAQEAANAGSPYVYDSTPRSGNGNVTTDVAKILEYTVGQNNDVIEKLQMGAYNSVSYVFDSLRGTVTKSTPESRRSIADEQSGSKLGDDDLTPSEQLKERPSRIFVGVAANKNNIASNREERETGGTDGDPDETLFSAAPARYNNLFTQILNITVPQNLELNAGQCIACDFPDVDKDSLDVKLTGKYLIKELCHYFGPNNKSFTYLTLVRDSFSS